MRCHFIAMGSLLPKKNVAKTQLHVEKHFQTLPIQRTKSKPHERKDWRLKLGPYITVDSRLDEERQRC